MVFTTLTAPIATGDTSITVANTNGLGLGLYVEIDSEIMLITGMTSGTTLTVARGQLGTMAVAHTTPGVNVTLAADQRGAAYVNPVPDIGAFEYDGVVPVGSTVTVTWTDGTSTTYDGNQHSATASWSSTGTDNGGGALTVTYVGINGTNYASSTTAPTNAGYYEASATFAGDVDHTGSSGSADFTIGQATLTVTGITANNKPYDGTDAATLNTGGAVLHGVVSGDTATVTFAASAATGTFASPDAAPGIVVQVAGITFAGTTQDGTLASVDYTLTQPTTTAAISQATLTVTGITANNKPYDGTPAATLNTAGAVLMGWSAATREL